MPTGRVRKGSVRIAGIVSDEVYHEIVRFMIDRGHPTISKALGAFLEECLQMRRSGVVPPAEMPAGEGCAPNAPGVVHPHGSVVHPQDSDEERG
jgi:hypothetical protein